MQLGQRQGGRLEFEVVVLSCSQCLKVGVCLVTQKIRTGSPCLGFEETRGNGG